MSVIGTFALPHPPLIIPEVGKGNEKIVEKTIESYKKIAKEIAKLKPETIIISSPHTVCFKDYFYISSTPIMRGSFEEFGAPNVSFDEKIDEELVQEIEILSRNEKFPAGRIEENINLDHGTMVPLYFIRNEYKNCKIIVVGLSGLSLKKHYEFGKIIDRAIDNLGRKVVFVASGDLSHKLQEDGPYGFIKEGPIYDDMIQKTLTNANFEELLEYDLELLEKCAECGHPSFTIMGGLLDKRSVKPTFYSHEDKTGVGYGIWSFYPNDECVKLAKDTIYTYIKENKKIEIPSNLKEELLKDRKGVFVSIHEKGNLRGCIGTFLPVHRCIAEEIIENAILASTEDPRFSEIKEEELDDLDINVDILTTPEKIDSLNELNPKKYGVIVQKDFRRGLLLPDIEGIDTAEEQIAIAKQKADIDINEEVSLQRFEVERHK